MAYRRKCLASVLHHRHSWIQRLPKDFPPACAVVEEVIEGDILFVVDGRVDPLALEALYRSDCLTGHGDVFITTWNCCCEACCHHSEHCDCVNLYFHNQSLYLNLTFFFFLCFLFSAAKVRSFYELANNWSFIFTELLWQRSWFATKLGKVPVLCRALELTTSTILLSLVQSAYAPDFLWYKWCPHEGMCQK